MVVFAAMGARLDAADPFRQGVQPFAEQYCIRCHNSKEARGELDLSRYAAARDVTADFRRWSHVIEFIRGGEMPPEDEPQPTIEERTQVAAALEAILLDEAQEHAPAIRRDLAAAAFPYRVRSLRPRSDRRRHPPDARLSGGSGGRRRFR